MKLERALEVGIFKSRWIMAPFYVGLVVSLALLLVKFTQELWHMAPHILEMSDAKTLLAILTLVDLTLAGNLLLIVIFAGYENFVSKIDTGESEDRPDWMGKVDFGGLKLKLIGTIVAISGIHLLKSFMNVAQADKEELFWLIIVHLTFVISGVLYAVMDWLAAKAHLTMAAVDAAHGGKH